MASTQLLRIADDFWNIRGSFKVGGVVDVGTHCSLLRLRNGNFVLLDAYTLEPSIKTELDRVTAQGAKIEAIINLHPFHTIHVERMHAMYPAAKLYGTARHLQKFPTLPWQSELSEHPEMHALYKDDIAFSVPQGTEFIPANENVHFSSVLAYHRNSRTIHVDDTFMYLQLPRALALVGMHDYMGLHPTLSQALEKRRGAAADLRQWVQNLALEWGDAQNLCAAHAAALTHDDNKGANIGVRIGKTLRHANWTLTRHQKKYG
jgi:hypothetical protein